MIYEDKTVGEQLITNIKVSRNGPFQYWTGERFKTFDYNANLPALCRYRIQGQAVDEDLRFGIVVQTQTGELRELTASWKSLADAKVAAHNFSFIFPLVVVIDMNNKQVARPKSREDDPEAWDNR